jgi:hypothetical protein
VDYVVYGTGYGATLMLLGYAIRTWGPNWRFRDQDAHGYEQQELRSAQSAWARFSSGLGAIIATCGAVLAVLTFLLMFINPGDDIGVPVALGATGLILAAVAVWAWMYFSRYGTWGVLSVPQPLSRYEPVRYAAGTGDVRISNDLAVQSGNAGEPTSDEAEEEHDTDAEPVEDEAFADEFEARYSKYELHHPDDVEDETPAEVDEGEVTDQPQEAGETEGEAGKDDSQPAAEAREVGDEASRDVASKDESSPSEADTGPVSDQAMTADLESGEGDHDRPGVADVVAVDTDVDADDGLQIIPEAHQPNTDYEEPAEDAAAVAGESAEERSGREDALRRLRERRARRGMVENDDS